MKSNHEWGAGKAALTVRSRGLHEIQRATVGTEEGAIALGQKITDIEQRFDVAGKERTSRQRLANDDAEEWISLSG